MCDCDGISKILSVNSFWEKIPGTFDISPYLVKFSEKSYLSVKQVWKIRHIPSSVNRLKEFICSIEETISLQVVKCHDAVIENGSELKNANLHKRLHSEMLKTAINDMIVIIEDKLRDKKFCSDAVGNSLCDVIIRELEKVKAVIRSANSAASLETNDNCCNQKVFQICSHDNQYPHGNTSSKQKPNAVEKSQSINCYTTNMSYHNRLLHGDMTRRRYSQPISSSVSQNLNDKKPQTKNKGIPYNLIDLAQKKSSKLDILKSNRQKSISENDETTKVKEKDAATNHHFDTSASGDITFSSVKDYADNTECQVLSTNSSQSLTKTIGSTADRKTRTVTTVMRRSSEDRAELVKSRDQNEFSGFQNVAVSPYRCNSVTTIVTVTDGEIADVIASDSNLDGSPLGLLDKLKHFSSPKPRKLKGRSFYSSSDDDSQSDNESISSCTSISSLSSDTLNYWLQDQSTVDEDEESNFFDKNDIIFKFPATNKPLPFTKRKKNENFIVPNQRVNNGVRLPDKKAKLPQCSEINHKFQHSAEDSRNSKGSFLPPLTKMDFNDKSKVSKGEDRNFLWKSQKSVFKSTKHLLATTTDFVKVLPDLLKLRIFSEDQLKNYNNFEDASSITILRAVGERIDEDPNVMAMFLVGLRSHNSDLVDRIHQKVYAELSQSRNMTDRAGTKAYSTDKIANHSQTRANTTRLASRHSFSSHDSVCGRYGNSYTSSRYSRRPYTTNVSTNEQERIINSSNRKSFLDPPASPYFSKAPIGRSLTPTSCLIEMMSQERDAFSSQHLKPDIRNRDVIDKQSNETSVQAKENASDIVVRKKKKKVKTSSIKNYEKRKKTESKGKVTTVPVNDSKAVEINRSSDIKAISSTAIQTSAVKTAIGSIAPKTTANLLQTSSSSLKRSASCREAVSEPIKAYLVEHKLNLTSRSIRKRSNSLSNNASEMKSDTSDVEEEPMRMFFADQDALLKQLYVKYSEFCSINCDVNNGTIHDFLRGKSLDKDIDASTSEMMKKCIVSARTAWMIRKCSKSLDRLKNFLQLLIGLPSNDINDVMKNCPRTRFFVRKLFQTLDSPKDQYINISNETNIICKDKASDGNTSITTSPSQESSKNEIESKTKMTSLLHDVTSVIESIPSDKSAVVETRITPITIPKQQSPTTFEKYIATSNHVNKMDLPDESLENKSEKTKRFEEGKNHMPEVKIKMNKETNITTKREAKEEEDSCYENSEEKITRIEKNSTTSATQVDKLSPCVVESASESASAYELTQIEKRERAVAINSSNQQSSEVKLSIAKPVPKSRSQRPGRSIKSLSTAQRPDSESPSFVSQVLFPISTRKNLLSRKVSQENGKTQEQVCVEEKKPVQVFSSEDSKVSVNQEISWDTGNVAIRNVIMPPEMPLKSNKNEMMLNKSIMEKEGVSTVKDFSSQDSNDLNNNKTCKTFELPTILINGGNVSPPSSCKRKSPLKVSFSDLPPIEFQLNSEESSWFSTSRQKHESEQIETFASPVSTSKVATRLNFSNIKRKSNVRPDTPMPSSDSLKPPIFPESANKNTNEIIPEKSPPPVNKIDQINELLMDILEEIEAENISLNRCLNDLVCADLLGKEQACSVSPTFNKCHEEYKINSNADVFEERLSESDRERCVEKLLDALTSLGIEKLQKCRNCILGRLCHLSPYKDFETAQKAAADAIASSPQNSRSSEASKTSANVGGITSASGNNTFSGTAASGRNLSNDDSEISATESDDDFHLLRKPNVLIRNQQTINEVDEDEIKASNEETSTNNLKSASSSMKTQQMQEKEYLNIRTMLTKLRDEKVLEPRQVWSVLGAGNDVDQRKMLQKTLKDVETEKLNQIYKIPGMNLLKNIMEEDLSFDHQPSNKLKNKTMKTGNDTISKNSASLQTSELHGGTEDAVIEALRFMEDHSMLRKQIEKTITPITSLVEAGNARKGKPSNRSSQKGVGRENSPHISASSIPAHQGTICSTLPQAKIQDVSLEEWCQSNKLASQSAVALRKSGYSRPSQLFDLSENSIEELEGLSWLHKAKLWVAIENLKLDEFYQRSHSGLKGVLKILET